MGKRLQKVLLALLFLLGLAVFSYPHICGLLVKQKMESTVQTFQEQQETRPTTSVVIPDSMQSSEQQLYPELWEGMTAYNEAIFAQGQSGLSCKLDYQQPSFRLMDYGLDEEVFGVITIPAMELEMPIYLGATEQHMADGAAHLSQTSLPIGGANTNSVIAGHRGYGGASYFRYIDKLKIGDIVTVTNLWETLTYRVAEIKIIYPYQVEEILIQPGRELLTLLTCHPYASGGKQRYLVICERVYQEDNYG
ncbi:MAG: class C sortase [Faecousia sp.]